MERINPKLVLTLLKLNQVRPELLVQHAKVQFYLAFLATYLSHLLPQQQWIASQILLVPKTFPPDSLYQLHHAVILTFTTPARNPWRRCRLPHFP